MLDPVSLIIQWLIVFVFNVVPAFAPPTWATLSFFYIAYPQNLGLLILSGVTASTVGRYCLAKLAGIFTEKFAKKDKKEELSLLGEKLSGQPWQRFAFTFLFALSPLPSNVLFIAVGVMRIKLKEVLIGFFVGRIISYACLVFIIEKVFSSVSTTIEGSGTWFGIAIEVIGFVAIIAFFVFDWQKLLGMKKPITRGAKWKKKK